MATTLNDCESKSKAETSLIIFAPFFIAAFITCDFLVSIDILYFLIFEITCNTLFFSFSTEISFAPGRVDSPPTSMTSVP